jgi:hypothetical protein
VIISGRDIFKNIPFEKVWELNDVLKVWVVIDAKQAVKFVTMSIEEITSS